MFSIDLYNRFYISFFENKLLPDQHLTSEIQFASYELLRLEKDITYLMRPNVAGETVERAIRENGDYRRLLKYTVEFGKLPTANISNTISKADIVSRKQLLDIWGFSELAENKGFSLAQIEKLLHILFSEKANLNFQVDILNKIGFFQTDSFTALSATRRDRLLAEITGKYWKNCQKAFNALRKYRMPPSLKTLIVSEDFGMLLKKE